MSYVANKFAKAAVSLVGTPFRLHGRDPHSGLDCVGLINESLKIAGLPRPQLPKYALRNSDYSFVLKTACLAGFKPAKNGIFLGDLVVVKPGPAQLHFLVAQARGGFVHAHASLREIVTMPGPVPWPIWAILRLEEKG